MNEKRQYTIEELVTNSDFISWVNNDMPSSSPWANIETDQSDFELIKGQAIDMVKQIRFEEETNTTVVKDNIWTKIDGAISTNTSSNVNNPSRDNVSQRRNGKIRPLYWIATAVAACFLFLFMFNVSNSDTGVIEIYSTESMVSHLLPDNSNIDLTAGSSIKYTEDGWSNHRNIQLTGEAFFEVQKGESFTVKSKNATVTVLGTSFNVKETQTGTEVICKTGKVKVKSNSSENQEIITANQSVKVDGSEVTKKTHSVIFIPWKETDFSFSNTTLDDVFKQIGSTFNVDISIDPIYLNKQFNGSFEKSKLEDALHNICWPMKLKYTIDGSQVTITSSE